MKSLEKERSRRYETANGLARDIDRYLHDEPVEARPPSASYIIGRLAHKHRRPLALVASVAVLLLAFTTTCAWLAARAGNAESELRSTNHDLLMAISDKEDALRKAQGAASAAEQSKQFAITEANAAKLARRDAQNAELDAKLAQGRALKAANDATAASNREKAGRLDLVAVLAFVEDHIIAAPRPARVRGGQGHNVTLHQAIEKRCPSSNGNSKTAR